jgi:calcineurin-like phosphoesterase family protein
MKTFFTSDHHFGHKNILKFTERPQETIEEMDQYLIDQWNKVVSEKDRVYYVGDFSYRAEKSVGYYLSKLNGNKIFIEGNHDDVEGIDKFNGVPMRQADIIKVGKQKIHLSHYPLRVWQHAHRGAWCLYGHTHTNIEDMPWGKSMDVGIDNAARLGFGYRPLEYQEIAELMKERKILSIDIKEFR